MEMDLPSAIANAQKEHFHAGWFLKCIHWLLSLAILVIFSSIGSVYSLINNYNRRSLIIQTISFVYSIIDSIWGYRDYFGHENKMCHGTGIFLIFFYLTVLIIGFYNSKTNNSNKVISVTYKVLSCLIVLCGVIRLSAGVVSMLEFCYDDHTGQCNAHGIMGMSFIVYGVLLSVVLVVPWLRVNKGKYSQEMYDSTVIMVWGVINTFTEHRPWEPWSHGDYQHTSMGIIFWAAGLLGMFLSINRKRNFMPALTMILTGYAMSGHVQELIISTKVHAFFGYVLMFGGLARIVEISFLLDDKDESIDGEIRSFQYLTPFALILSGILFMGANEEQMQLVVNLGADHSSYILTITSAAMILQLWILALLRFYLKLTETSKTNNSAYDDINTLDHSDGQSQFELDNFSV